VIKIAKAIKAFFIALFTNWIEDFLILTGIILGVVNTYLIGVINTNVLAGNYTVSAVLFLLGIVLARRG
jgi:hypothetical protein